MTSVSRVEDQVRSDIFTALLPAAGPAAPGRDEDLLTILDSLQVLRMAVQVETTFGIRIDNSELTEENVGTLRRLAAFIAGKLERRGDRP